MITDEARARRFAAEEVEAYRATLTGVYGAEAKATAERAGLDPVDDGRGVKRSIAEEVEEHSDHFLVRDLCTGKVYQRPFSSLRGKAPRPCRRCQAAIELAAALPELTSPPVVARQRPEGEPITFRPDAQIVVTTGQAAPPVSDDRRRWPASSRARARRAVAGALAAIRAGRGGEDDDT